MEVDPRKLILPDKEFIPMHDAFILKATHLWFEWLNWALILGLLGYVREKTGAIPVTIILMISYTFLFTYFFARFRDLRLKDDLFKNRWVLLVLSVLFAFTITAGTWWLLFELAQILAKNPGGG
jgi:hypothetical protein